MTEMHSSHFTGVIHKVEEISQKVRDLIHFFWLIPIQSRPNLQPQINDELNENKEEIHYLKNKLDQKYDVIDDIENELDKAERKLKEAKEHLEAKEKEFEKLKMLIIEQVDEINILRDNDQSMITQIS